MNGQQIRWSLVTGVSGSGMQVVDRTHEGRRSPVSDATPVVMALPND